MKELEEKIWDLLDENINSTYDGSILGKDEAAELIAKEVKDIAIEFAIHREDYFRFPAIYKTDAELFDQFIAERYKP